MKKINVKKAETTQEFLAEEWLEKGRLITFSLKGISLKNENHLALLKGKYISEPMKLFIRLAQDPELF